MGRSECTLKRRLSGSYLYLIRLPRGVSTITFSFPVSGSNASRSSREGMDAPANLLPAQSRAAWEDIATVVPQKSEVASLLIPARDLHPNRVSR